MTFVGNATTIIRFGGFTLLTDPNFLHRGQHAYLGYGVRTRRLQEPALTMAELPELDGVILTHLHEDHWDGLAERDLDTGLPIITTPAAARTLRERGFHRADGLPTWRDRELVKGHRRLRVTAMPGRHGPGPLRHLLPPVMGPMLDFGPVDGPFELRIYISGDTLLNDDLAEVPHAYPHIDLGIIHLGGTRLFGLIMVTMDGRQGADWVRMTECATVMPVHYDDYTVMKSPLSDFETEIERRGLTDRLRVVPRGHSLPLRPSPAVHDT